MTDGVRPDFSPFVAHFTRASYVKFRADISRLTAIERLARILDERRIQPTRMYWFGARCAAFTECTWTSLLDHATRYSSYGIGFDKRLLWSQGGGPAMYLRCSTLYDAQAEYKKRFSGSDARPFADEVRDFLSPFALEPFQLRRGTTIPPVDFTHEREWRAPSGLSFSCDDVRFAVVDRFEDLDMFPKAAHSGKGLGSERGTSPSSQGSC